MTVSRVRSCWFAWGLWVPAFGVLMGLVSTSAEAGRRLVTAERRAQAMGYFISAKSFEQRGDNRGAIVELLEAADLDPDAPTILHSIARNYLYIGNYDRAVQYSRRSVELDPSFSEGRRFLVRLLANRGDQVNAARDLEVLVRDHPDDWESVSVLVTLLLDRGEQKRAFGILMGLKKQPGLPAGIATGAGGMLFNMKRYKEAAAFYRTALVADSTAEEAWLGLGLIYEATGEGLRAVSVYREGLAKAPESNDLFGRLALVYAGRGLLDTVIASEAESPDFLYSLSIALIQAERFDQAAKVLMAVVERSDSLDSEQSNNLAYALLKAERYDDAALFFIGNSGRLSDAGVGAGDAVLSVMKHAASHLTDRPRVGRALGEALDREPEDAFLLWCQAAMLTAEEKWTEATPFLARASDRSPQNTDYLFDLGNALERSGCFDEAVEVFERLLKIEPDNGYALNYLGYMFAEKGIRLEEAVELLKKALADRPDNGAFLDSLGWAYFRLGALDKAEDYIERAVRQIEVEDSADKENAVIYEHLGDVASALGKADKARAQWTRSLEIDPANATARQKLNSLTTR